MRKVLTICVVLIAVFVFNSVSNAITIPVTGDYWVTGNPDDVEHLGNQSRSDWIDPNPVLTRDWSFNISIAPISGPGTGTVSLYASNINDGISNYLWINLNGWMTTLNITMPGAPTGIIDDTYDTFLFQSHIFDSSNLSIGTNILRIASSKGSGSDYDDFEVTALTIDYTPIPEPVTILLLGIGVVMLRKKRTVIPANKIL